MRSLALLQNCYPYGGTPYNSAFSLRKQEVVTFIAILRGLIVFCEKFLHVGTTTGLAAVCKGWCGDRGTGAGKKETQIEAVCRSITSSRIPCETKRRVNRTDVIEGCVQMNETRKTTEIKFREDLYPRFEPKQSLIQQYAYSLEFLPPIKINQDNILIDGYHRWKAHQMADGASIPVEIIQTQSDKEIKRLAYQLNSNHGLQLTQDEKRKYANEMIGDMTGTELSKLLSVDEATISRWTKSRREQLDEERNRLIIENYLKAWNTEESIAKMFNLASKSRVSEIISQFGKLQMQETERKFKPFIYNIWSINKQDNAVDSHFGAFPQIFMENLLYYHTQPLDIVYDPFAGAGTTIDACKLLLRRYYCSDRKIKPGREKDILAAKKGGLCCQA